VIRFRPIAESDVPLLQKWLERDHVALWWRNEDASQYLAQRTSTIWSSWTAGPSG